MNKKINEKNLILLKKDLLEDMWSDLLSEYPYTIKEWYAFKEKHPDSDGHQYSIYTELENGECLEFGFSEFTEEQLNRVKA